MNLSGMFDEGRGEVGREGSCVCSPRFGKREKLVGLFRGGAFGSSVVSLLGVLSPSQSPNSHIGMRTRQSAQIKPMKKLEMLSMRSVIWVNILSCGDEVVWEFGVSMLRCCDVAMVIGVVPSQVGSRESGNGSKDNNKQE